MHQRMFLITTVKSILLALLIAVAMMLFALLSSFTSQCIYRNGARAEDKVVCLRLPDRGTLETSRRRQSGRS